jgi:hypothetical protein
MRDVSAPAALANGATASLPRPDWPVGRLRMIEEAFCATRAIPPRAVPAGPCDNGVPLCASLPRRTTAMAGPHTKCKHAHIFAANQVD